MSHPIRETLQTYARTIQGKCGEIMTRTARLAVLVEDLLKYRDHYDTSIEDMDDRYQWVGKAYMLIEGQPPYINAASGAHPIDDRVKQELRLYEYARPRLKDALNDLDYCDEMWFFTDETLASGYVDYTYIAENIHKIEQIDLTQIHPWKLVRLNWFDIVNPVNDPERKGAWSPFPFIEMYGQWIFSFHYPFYDGDQFKGVFVPHANIEPMLADSIYQSPEIMLAIHDDGTLVGLNEAAAGRFKLENYKARLWEDLVEKLTYVRHDLNLTRNASEDFTWLVDGLRWQREFVLTIQGVNYRIVKERVPEIGLNLVAMLPI